MAMEGELDIKLDNISIIFRLLVLQLITLFLLTSCSQKSPANQTVRVLVGGGMGGFCFFEVKSDGKLEVTRMPYFVDTQSDDSISGFSEQKEITLSKKNLKEINEMIIALSNSEPYTGEERAPLDADYVMATVEGETYWSVYADKKGNQELLNLTYKLIELSPIVVINEIYILSNPNDYTEP